MNRPGTSWFLAVIALLSLAAPSVQAEWRCEGRVCGTTLWYCCCASPEGSRDPNCRRPSGSLGVGSDCAAGCGCTLTLRPSGRPSVDAASSFPLADLHPSAPLLESPSLEKPTEPRWLARSTESRGPPAQSLTAPPLGLRAPPAA